MAVMVPLASPCALGNVYEKVLASIEVTVNVPLNAVGEAPEISTELPVMKPWAVEVARAVVEALDAVTEEPVLAPKADEIA